MSFVSSLVSKYKAKFAKSLHFPQCCFIILHEFYINVSVLHRLCVFIEMVYDIIMKYDIDGKVAPSGPAATQNCSLNINATVYYTIL